MPRQHLARQATPGSPVRQQLDALARLHAHICLGQPATVSRLCVASDTISEEEANGLDSRLEQAPRTELSPAGDSVLVLRRFITNSHDLAQLAAQAEVEGLDAGGEQHCWRHASKDTFTVCAAAWSPDAHLGVVALGTDHKWLSESESESKSEPESEPESKDFTVVCAFDSIHRCWLHEHLLPGVLPDKCATVRVCDSAALPVAAFRGRSTDTEEPVLIVCQLAAPCVQVFCLTGTSQASFLWLPGSHTLVVQEADCLAWLNVLSFSSGMHWPEWVALPETPKPRSTAMAACPRGRALWVVQAVDELQGGYRFCVSVHTAAQGACVGTWSLDIKGAEQQSGSLHIAASRQAVAIGFGLWITRVYSLTGPMTLGEPLFTVTDQLQGLAFSTEGSFIVAYQPSCCQLVVRETRTGSRVACISRPNGQEEDSAYGHSVAWGLNPSQLLVSSVSGTEGEDLLFSVLQW